MNLLAILLVGASAFTHASWNLIAKSRTPSAAFFLLLTVASVILSGGLVLILFPSAFSAIPGKLWLLFLLTGVFQAFYYTCLANSYRLSEISVAYPLARAIPVLLTPGVVALFTNAKPPAPAALAGMALTFIGCVSLPQRKFSDIFRMKNYWNTGFLFVLATALFVTGYTLVDKEGLRLMEQTGFLKGLFPVSLFFITMENAMICVFLIPYVLLYKPERAALKSFFRKDSWFYPVLAAVLCTGGYMLVLSGMQCVRNVSYVVAFRQLSIPIGAAFGILLLKEHFTWPKLTGLILMLIGLVYVALY